MARAPRLTGIAELSIGEIAQLLAREMDVPSSLVERQLQLFLINKHRAEVDQPPIERFSDLELGEGVPSTDALMTREMLEEFCAEMEWPPPAFWTDAAAPPSEESVASRGPGRPTRKDEILEKFGERVGQELVDFDGTLGKEANALAEIFPDYKPRSIERFISQKFRELKSAR